jgi:hypothetical protein
MQIEAMKTETNLNNFQNIADGLTFNGFSDMVKGGEYFYKKSDNNPKEALEALGNIGMGFGKCVAVAIPAEQLLKVTGKAGIYLFKIIGKTKAGKSIVKYIGKEANAIGKKLGIKPAQKKVIDGASRAAEYGKGWPKASLKETVNKFAPGAKPIKTQSGKLIYKNTETGIQVVYDTKGNYFTIENINTIGKRRYLDINGQNIANKTINGKQMGRPKEEYRQMTHFFNIDK